ncbi:tetratricopeptide repeat protein [Planktothricoides raciborskii]|uniref:Tetratricopeptide repeat protein n=1 Tax=Planktothricoides raciborskii GIHE-MW2 TaxID=2792601 RepID=A0AAU8JEZ7_9CYAN
MMTESNHKPTTDLDGAIESYQAALNELESAAPNLSEIEAVKVLLARDAVQQLLPDKTKLSAIAFISLIQLDRRLKQQGEAIARAVNLEQFREPLNPDPSAWWWFFELPPEIDPWDRFDWVWNVITTGALGLAGSYLFITLQAFAIGGLGVTEAFGTIAQGTGIALIGKGALTADGHQQVAKLLHKMGVPSKWHSEVSCGFAMLLLLSVYGIHRSLPNYLYKKAVAEYDAGNLAHTEEKLLQAIQLNSEDSKFYVPLGKVYESTGELDKALVQYKNAVVNGNPEGFNSIGRVYIQQSKFDLAETLLRAGLQRVKNDPQIEYQLHRNLGWALLAQKNYPAAERELRQAIAIDDQITEEQIGGGMAYCFLGEALTEQKKMSEAEKYWLECLDYARPETVNEYRWFVQNSQRELASCVDTSGITGGLDHELATQKVAQSCDREGLIQSIKSAAIPGNQN